jgi:hypothetical protein
MSLRSAISACFAGLAIVLAGAVAVPAQAMETEQIGKHLCKVKGGGKFVPIPGFPGEKIDRRLIPDIKWMKRKYKIFITDGYATSGHAPNGEHPIGLAVDIIPRQHGGRWGLIDKLAKRFEPRQNHVRMPMRWVGYDGDANHGRGHHLHLSWAHSDTPPRKPARVVYTRKCPDKFGGDGSGDGGGGGSGGSGGTAGGGQSGGVNPKRGSGGLTAAERAQLAPVVPELHEHSH